tara:strand:+ start:1349 stop:2446 length:1098 start_codon:yes stop_codon:yes gene_type:complete
MSLKNWSNSGYIEREFKYFKRMNELHGVNFTIVSYGDAEDYDYCKSLDFINVIPIYEHIKQKKNKIYNLIFLSFNFQKLMKKLRPDFDLIKTNQLYGAWMALLTKRKFKKPLIIRTGYDLFIFSVKDNKNIFKKIAYYLLTLISLNYSDLFTVTSNTDLKFIKKYYIFNKQKIKLRNNWVDNFSNSKELKRDKSKVLAVGRLEKQKDYKYLIEAFKDSKFQLDIVGSGSLEDELKFISSDNINFFGNLDFKDLDKLYSNYLFYISSSDFEGNPKSMLEAMSKGCIIIAPNQENISEIISHRVNGVLYTKKKNNILGILNELIKDEQTMKKISKNAIDHTIKNNSLELFLNKEIADFKNVMKNKGN